MLELIKSKVFIWVLFGFVLLLSGAVVYTHLYTKNERNQYWEDKIRNSPVVVRDTVFAPPIIKPILVKGKPVVDSTLQKKLDSLRTLLQNKEQIEEYLATPFQAELQDSLVELEILTAYPITKEIKRDVTYKPLPGKIFERQVLVEPPVFAVEVGISQDLRVPLKLWYENYSVGGLFGRGKPIWLVTYRLTF